MNLSRVKSLSVGHTARQASLAAQRVKNPPANAGDPCSVPGLGRSPGEGNGYPLQYSGLENSMDCIKSMGSQRVGHE